MDSDQSEASSGTRTSEPTSEHENFARSAVRGRPREIPAAVYVSKFQLRNPLSLKDELPLDS